MTAEEIRKTLPERMAEGIAEAQDVVHQQAIATAACCSVLIEIAAQLAEHNAHLDRLEWLAENVISLNCGGLQVKVNQ